MSNFGRTTKSTNLNLGRNNMNNVLLNKTGLGNLNGNKQLLANKQPLKRNALQSATNLLNNKNINLNLNGKFVDSNNLNKKDVKVSTTENEFVKTTKGLGGVPRASKIPTRNEPKLEQQIKNLKSEQQSKESIKQQLEDNLLRFSSFAVPENVENIDQYDEKNVLLANEFSNDIYMYLRHLEESFKLKNNFLEIQKHLTPKMRARLIDWIIAVHHKFKLLPETLYLTIAIMDRFLEKVNVVKDKVQLVGLTAFFIACKYEEIYPPEIQDFLNVCDAYPKNEILKMERTILKTLDFNISYPLPLHFLRRFSKAAHANQEIHTLAKYLMELGLVEYECSSWKPSLLAAASLYLTLQILSFDNNEPVWTNTLAFYTNHKEADLQPYVSILCKILLTTKESKLQTVHKKYSSLKLLSISISPKLNCDYVLNMADKFI